MAGRHGHVVQLNAAGRQIIGERGGRWSMVDLEPMAQWFAHPKVRIGLSSLVPYPVLAPVQTT